MTTRAPKNRPQLQSIDLDRATTSKPLTSEKSQRIDHASLANKPPHPKTDNGPKEPSTKKTKGGPSRYEKNSPGYSH